MQFKVNRNQNKPSVASSEGWLARNSLRSFFLRYTQIEIPTPASTPNATTINAESNSGEGSAGPEDPLGDVGLFSGSRDVELFSGLVQLFSGLME